MKNIEENRFESFSPAVGARVTLETSLTERRYNVELLGYANNRSIMVSAPLIKGKEVLLSISEPLITRLLVRNKVLAFETKVIYRSVNPFSYYHLEYPNRVTATQIRESERVQVELPVEIHSEFDIGSGDWPIQGFFSNISKQGALLRTQKTLGGHGHEIILKFTLDVDNFMKTIAVPATIKNVDPPKLGPKGTEFSYGVQFHFTNPQDALMLTSFVYEHSVDQTKSL